MRLAVATVAMLGLSGCVSIAGLDPASPGASIRCERGKPMVETMLFLGMASPKGPVSQEAFQKFVEAEVSPRWKEGYTILEAQGLWLSQARNLTEREPSRVLLRFHDGSAHASADIEAIRAAYIKAFTQDAVLRTDRPACADFG